jgi:hypothetical protein
MESGVRQNAIVIGIRRLTTFSFGAKQGLSEIT